ncbi:MAG TPA: DUF1801 domain-containing protein [Gemmatimonadaceae bacterium]|nr:DUF1801 domain-containing protein [Gemmatimonadaceae bacterium]
MKRKAPRKQSSVFTAEERAAMREHAQEVKRSRGPKPSESDEPTVLAKIDSMPEPDRSMGRRLHAIVRSAAPDLVPRLWYGMPAYSKNGNVVCFFQNAAKFKSRYSTLGFSDKAALDDGEMWPTSFALKALTKAGEARITALVKQAVYR